MKKFYIVGNSSKYNVKKTADYIMGLIKDRNACAELKLGYSDISMIDKDVDCIITLGGDGTLIRVARDCAELGIPIIGVNLGHLGYLTSFGSEDRLEDMFDKLIADEYSIESRMMIDGFMLDEDEQVHISRALNEIVISSNTFSKFIKCRIYVNGELLNEYWADGIIIATPTGSTAYNLSAGGPIVEPGARMLIITAVSPHALNQRSIVLAPESEIEVEILKENRKKIAAVFDGDKEEAFDYKRKLLIKESKICTKLIKLRGGTFLDNLRTKMSGI